MQDSELLNVYTAKEAIVGSSIVSFDDGADDATIKSLLANIKPVQDLHGYSKPWAGGAGTNLCRVARTFDTASAGITFTEDEFGTVHCEGTATAEALSAGNTTESTADSRCLNPLPAGSYTISNIGTVRVHVVFRNSDNTANYGSARNVQAGGKSSFVASEPIIVYIRADILPGETVDADVLCMVTAGSTMATVFEPYQNICPITGSTSLSVYRTGRNLFDFNSVFTAGTGTIITKNQQAGTINVKNSSSTRYCGFGVWYNGILSMKPFPVGKYTLSFDVSGDLGGVNFAFGVRSVANYTFVNSERVSFSAAGHYTVTFDSSAWTEDYYLSASRIGNSTADVDVTFYNLQIEVGETASAFEPYVKNTYSVNWNTQAGTVYGSSIDLINGESTVTMANIASYNGETIGEPWLSSLDEYSPGATPTTGAQVVYTLATPIMYQLTPVQIRTISGKNNVWTDVGEIASLEYFVEQNKSFIDRLFVDGIDLQEKGWFLKWRKLSAPKPKTDYLSVFARDGDIDLTETNGQVFYEDRAIAMDMVYIGNEWEKDYSELLGLVHGQRLHVQFANDPAWYWSARLAAEIYEKKPRSLTMNGLAFPYKFDIVKTSASATVSGATEGTATTVTLEATRMPVSPKVTVTGTVTLKWGSATKQLSAGTYYVDGLKVGKDGLSVKVWGTGTATFEYRRGAL